MGITIYNSGILAQIGNIPAEAPSFIFPANTSKFNGTSDFKTYTNRISSNTFTIETHMKLDDVTTQQRIVTETNGSQFIMTFYVQDGELNFGYRDSASAFKSIVTSVSLNIGQEYHVLARLNTADTMKIYVDGVDEASLAVSLPILSTSISDQTIGASTDGGASGFIKGSLAMFGFLDIALTSSEVGDLFNASNISTCYANRNTLYKNNDNGFYRFCNFDGNTGEELDDQSGSNALTGGTITDYSNSGLSVECLP